MLRMHIWVWVFPVLGVFLIALILFLAVRHPHSGNEGIEDSPERIAKAKAAKPALKILNKRYASGEITKEEYEYTKKNILE